MNFKKLAGLILSFVLLLPGISWGYIGEWKFEGNWSNEVPGGPSAVPYGATFFTAGGISGGYAKIPLSIDWIEIPWDSAFDLPDSFTIEFWFRQRSDQSFLQDLVYKGTSPNSYNFRIFRQLWNQFNYGPVIAGFTSYTLSWEQVRNPNQLAHHVWHYVAYTKDTNGHAYYLDGVLIHSATTTDLAEITPSKSIIIGDSAVDTDIDELRISDIALTATEIYDYYNSFVPAGGGISPDIPVAISPNNEAIFTAGPVTLQASAFFDYDGDTHVQTRWLVRREDRVFKCPDYDVSFDHVATTAGLTEHTVYGLDPGLKYVWKVGYVDSGSGNVSWSQEYTFKIGTYEWDSGVWIYPGISAVDYKMVSFVHWPDDPACASVFADEMGGSYDTINFRIGTYDPTSGTGAYRECGSNLKIEPGRAYWVLARDGTGVTVNGIPVSQTHDIEVGLRYNPDSGDGWNMIAAPNNGNYYWDDVEAVEYDSFGNIVSGPTAISSLSVDNGLIDKGLWRWEYGAYYFDTTWMERHKGYWVRVKKENVFLRFPASARMGFTNPATLFASLLSEGKSLVKAWILSPEQVIANPEDSPPAPMGDFRAGTSTGNPSVEVGGEVGCFIATAAQGSLYP